MSTQKSNSTVGHMVAAIRSRTCGRGPRCTHLHVRQDGGMTRLGAGVLTCHSRSGRLALFRPELQAPLEVSEAAHSSRSVISMTNSRASSMDMA